MHLRWTEPRVVCMMFVAMVFGAHHIAIHTRDAQHLCLRRRQRQQNTYILFRGLNPTVMQHHEGGDPIPALLPSAGRAPPSLQAMLVSKADEMGKWIKQRRTLCVIHTCVVKFVCELLPQVLCQIM